MLNVINQFRRMYNDDGRNDKSFAIDEFKLRASLKRLTEATDKLIKASRTLSDLLIDKHPPGALH